MIQSIQPTWPFQRLNSEILTREKVQKRNTFHFCQSCFTSVFLFKKQTKGDYFFTIMNAFWATAPSHPLPPSTTVDLAPTTTQPTLSTTATQAPSTPLASVRPPLRRSAPPISISIVSIFSSNVQTSPNVCQLRLDFDEMEIQQPDPITHQCTSDRWLVLQTDINHV